MVCWLLGRLGCLAAWVICWVFGLLGHAVWCLHPVVCGVACCCMLCMYVTSVDTYVITAIPREGGGGGLTSSYYFCSSGNMAHLQPEIAFRQSNTIKIQ